MKISFFTLLLTVYLFLLIFRPYEYWPSLGEFRVERLYMLCFMTIVFFSKEKRFLPSLVNGAIFLLFMVLLLSGVFSISWDASWVVLENYLKYLVFYILIILCVKDENDFRFIIVSFIIVMFLYVGKSAWEFFFNGRYVYRMGIARMIGIDVTYADPNAFAASICYSLPLTWAVIRSNFEQKWIRILVWVYFFLSILAIILTGSRSGMATALLFFGITYLACSRKIIGLVLISALLFTSWQLMPDDLQIRFLSIFYDDVGPENAQQSADGRLEGFLHGIAIFSKNPVLGVGPGNYPLSWDIGMNAHNLYGQILGELGSLGAIVFILLILSMLYYNLKICNKIQFSAANSKKRTFYKNSSAIVANTNNQFFYNLIAQAVIYTVILMLFKGWGDHNLYRYTWLWLAALTVLGYHFAFKEPLQNGKS